MPIILQDQKQINLIDWHGKHPPSEIDDSEDSKYSDMRTQEEQNDIEIVRHKEYYDLTEIYKPASDEFNVDLQ